MESLQWKQVVQHVFHRDLHHFDVFQGYGMKHVTSHGNTLLMLYLCKSRQLDITVV